MNTKIAFLVVFFTFIELTVILPSSAMLTTVNRPTGSGFGSGQGAGGGGAGAGGGYEQSDQAGFFVSYDDTNLLLFFTSIWSGLTIVLWFLWGISMLPLVGSND